MLELFSHYVLHFERYFILSRQSTLLVQWSIVVLAGLYLLVHHPKINRYRTMFLAGVILRIVLLTGLSVELIHQVQLTNFTSAYLRDNGNKLLLEEMRFKQRYYGLLLVKAACWFGAAVALMLIIKLLI